MTESRLYKTPFSSSYWKEAFGAIKSTKMLLTAALLIAIQIVVGKLFYIQVAENLRILFAFLPASLMCMACGPVLGPIAAVAGDLLGVIVFPNGPFFIGYTVSAFAGALVYSLMLYRARISVLRLALSKTIINYFVNVLLGSVWSAVLFEKGYYYYFSKSLLKNTLMLPIEIILMYLIFQAMLPVMPRFGLIPRQPSNKIKLF